MMEEHYDLLMQYALSNANYQNWRKEHTKIFGDIFDSAFSENLEAQIHLTAALINISNRKFEEALPKLDILETVCANEFDETAISYFKGLNYELLENEQKMTEYYEKVRVSSVSFVFPIGFHPYYRTAKMAQRNSECSKAVYYYQKALEFYDGIVPDAMIAASASQITYDVATVCLYMHHYDECENFLQWSNQFDSSVNQQRNYVTAILYALQGKRDECRTLLRGMNLFFRRNCEPMVDAIFDGLDLHYCVVPQNRTAYNDFWSSVLKEANDIMRFMDNGDTDKAQTVISQKLSDTLDFVKRKIECRMEKSGDTIVVYCKSYCIKSLIAEYSVLFAQKPAELVKWSFVSVDEWEKYI